MHDAYVRQLSERILASMSLVMRSASSNLERRISFRSDRPAATDPSLICDCECVRVYACVYVYV
jgi:hypothetical protein